MSEYHNVGVMFKNTSKSGKEFYTINLFQSANQDDNVKILGFKQTSKKGNEYWSLTIPGEGSLKDKMVKLNAEMKRHLEAEGKDQKPQEDKKEDFDNSKLVEDVGF